MSNLVKKLSTAWRRRIFRDERGISLIEIMVATSVMAVGITGVIGTMTSGFSLVGQARQRSSATSVAQQKLEFAHNLQYAQVALNTCVDPHAECPPAHSTDPTNPDYNVSTDGASYYPNGSGTSPAEPLVIATCARPCTPSGAIAHIDDPVTVGVTEFNIYQYVSWVDDPTIDGTQNYKRVVVVVTWKYPVRSTSLHAVTAQTFISDGTVTVPGTTPVPSSSATPAPSPTPTPTPSGSPTPTPSPCPGDTSAPSPTSLTLLSGTGASQGYTNSTTAQVQLTATDTCSPITADLSNDGINWVTVSQTLTSGVATSAAWTLPSGDGTKTVRARFRDGVGNLSGVLTGTLILDTVKPSSPGNVRKVTISCSGTNRSITLTWDPSSDTNLLGYRLYKSVGGAAYTFISSTSSASVTDASKKTDVVNYVVRAYDKAGNESLDSNVFTLAKNTCS